MSLTNSKDSLPLIFGAAGDLVNKKFAVALAIAYKAWIRLGLPFPQTILATDINTSKLETFPAILEKGIAQSGEEFTNDEHADYLRRFVTVPSHPGTLIDIIKSQMQIRPNANILPYLAVPYKANPTILRSFAPLREMGLGERIFPTFEKPAALSLAQLDEIKSILLANGTPHENATITEHFIPKFFQLMEWMYGNGVHNAILRYPNVKRVRIIVREELGGDERAYWGIMGDSIFNHLAALLGTILGNPGDKLYSSLGVSIMGRLRQMIFKPEDGMMPPEIKEAQTAFMRRMDPHGIYAHCFEDHEDTPTGVFLSFNPPSHRWGNTDNGGTHFTVEWMKNSHEKTTEVSFEFKHGEVWRFMIDGYYQGDRSWGYTMRSKKRTHDGRAIPHTIGHFEAIDPRLVDGYPAVVENWLLGRRHNTLPLEAQQVSLEVFGPWAATLDSLPVDKRIKFHKGQKPFNGGNPGNLVPLYNQAV